LERVSSREGYSSVRVSIRVVLERVSMREAW